MSTARSSRLPAILLLLIVAGAGFAAVRSLRGATPVHIGSCKGQMLDPSQHGDAWYWIERPAKGAARLLRATRNAEEQIASADDITGYDVSHEGLVWSERHGTAWAVMQGDGKSARPLWQGAESAGRPCYAEGKVCFTLSRAGVIRTGSAVPTLGAAAQVYAAGDKGAPMLIGSIPEEAARLLGAHDGQVYASASRNGPPGAVAVYSLPLKGGPAARLAGDLGTGNAALGADGTVYWSCQSRDSSNVNIVCIRAVRPGGKPETVADWLPRDGHPFILSAGTYYVDAGPTPSFWRFTDNGVLPVQTIPPHLYLPVAVGETEALVRSMGMPADPHEVYTIAKP